MIKIAYKSLLKYQLNKFEYSGKVNELTIIEKVAVLPKYKIIFFRVPKAANSSVFNSFVNPLHPDIKTHDDLNYFKQKKYSAKRNLSFLSGRAYKNFNTITVVRHPISRIISCYLHLFKSKMKPNALGLNCNSSFDELLTKLENGGLYRNAHWAPQADILPNKENLDLIMKVESLQTDWFQLQEKLNINLPLIDFKLHATKSKNFKITDKQIDRIYKLYSSDFVNFDYSLD